MAATAHRARRGEAARAFLLGSLVLEWHHMVPPRIFLCQDCPAAPIYSGFISVITLAQFVADATKQQAPLALFSEESTLCLSRCGGVRCSSYRCRWR